MVSESEHEWDRGGRLASEKVTFRASLCLRLFVFVLYFSRGFLKGGCKSKRFLLDKTTKVSKIPSSRLRSVRSAYSRFYSDVTINPFILLVNPEGSFSLVELL
ncbi:unnamed protein product (mitochondrion) [Musa textilis]